MAIAENELNEMSSGISDSAKIIIEENRKIIETYNIKLLPLARIMISSSKEKLSGKVIELISTGRENTFRSGVVTANLLSRLFSSAMVFSSGRIKAIEASRQNLIVYTLNSVNNKKNILTGLDNTLNILNPENVLRRGYTITSLNGEILKSSNKLNKDDIIDTRFTDGIVTSKVVDKN
jgi:exodeoxyribonuclease VII large subunit